MQWLIPYKHIPLNLEDASGRNVGVKDMWTAIMSVHFKSHRDTYTKYKPQEEMSPENSNVLNIVSDFVMESSRTVA
jgi:hypothetical protein